MTPRQPMLCQDIGAKVPMPTPEQRKAIIWLFNENKAKDKARREHLTKLRAMQRAARAPQLQRLQLSVHHLRRLRIEEIDEYVAGIICKESPIDSMVSRLCAVRPQRSGTQTAGERLVSE